MEVPIGFTLYSLMMKKGNYNFFTVEYRSKYLPTNIIGDFDSIKGEVRKYYESKGVKITHNKD